MAPRRPPSGPRRWWPRCSPRWRNRDCRAPGRPPRWRGFVPPLSRGSSPSATWRRLWRTPRPGPAPSPMRPAPRTPWWETPPAGSTPWPGVPNHSPPPWKRSPPAPRNRAPAPRKWWEPRPRWRRRRSGWRPRRGHSVYEAISPRPAIRYPLSDPEQRLRSRIAQQRPGFERGVLGPLQSGIFRQDIVGHLPRHGQQVVVVGEPGHPDVGVARLTLAQQIALAALLEIQLGNPESIGGGGKGPEPGRGPVGHQHAMAGLAAPPDPAPELVQLGQPEPLGMLDHHHRGVGYVDSHLDDRGRHQHLHHPGAEPLHYPVALLGPEPAMHQAHRQVGPALPKGLGHGGRGAEIGLLGLVDDRQHHVSLPSGAAFLPHELEHLLPLPGGADRGAHLAPARGLFPEHRHVEIAIAGERERPGDRRGGKQEYVGRRALADQRRPLLDPEAVLLVDDHQPEI